MLRKGKEIKIGELMNCMTANSKKAAKALKKEMEGAKHLGISEKIEHGSKTEKLMKYLKLKNNQDKSDD